MKTKTHFNLLSIILISLSIRSAEPTVFCNQKDSKLVDAVFSIYDDIYLVRGQEIWISPDGQPPDPTPIRLSQKFTGLDGVKKLMTAFIVESVPKSCDESTEKEKCIFNKYMNGTAFIFYKKEIHSNQVYSMIKWNPKSLTFNFDEEVGGYGYMLRANRSVGRSTWPGIRSGSDEIIGSLFVSNDNQIVLFTNTNNFVFAVKKHLNEEWDAVVVPKQHTDLKADMFVGAFRKGNDYYFIRLHSSTGEVFKFNGNDFNSGELVGKDRAFFGCP